MTIQETCFPLFFYLALVIHPADRHFERSEKSFSSPFSMTSSLSRLQEAPSHLSAIRCFPFLAVRRSPSYRQRKRSLDFASDDDTGNAPFPHILCMMHGIAIPHAVISSAARNLFRPLFPTTPSLSRLREAPSPPFLRYGVSRFSLSDTRPLAANEKDPSASLGMTIRETCFLNTIFSRSTEMPISRLFTSLSFISRL